MVSEMDTVKNVAQSVNAAYLANPNQPMHSPIHTPQSVGVEFVRQYYTMLNRAPHLLFRFYSDDSTFVHGCLDKRGESLQCVRGQKQINNKILSLDFNNCHTKIRQVDSMETIGNGVVIQVIGELSNNGQPLRRFLQTFVLTSQSPNKYYVRNDIFRYYDEVFGEEADEQMENHDLESKFDNSGAENAIHQNETIEKEYSYQPNGTIANAAEVAAEQASAVDEGVDLQEEPESVQESSIEVNTSLVDVIENKEPEVEVEDEVEEIEPPQDVTMIVNQNSNEPKTYASMLSKSFQGPVAVPGPNISAVKITPIKVVTPIAPVVANNIETAVVTEPTVVAHPQVAKSNAAGLVPPQRDRFVKKERGFNRRNESRGSVKNNDSDSADGDSHFANASAKKSFSDDHQLFIGNLLPNFSEEELHNIFVHYGKILEVRINRQTHKTNSNKASRNYGFITFENPEVVDQIIAQKPIFHDNHRYNVEKKQGKSYRYRYRYTHQ